MKLLPTFRIKYDLSTLESVILLLLYAASEYQAVEFPPLKGRTIFPARCIHHLQDLALRDLQANRYLRNIVSHIPQSTRLRNLTERYLTDFVDSNGFTGVSEDVDELTKNPLRVYRLVRRFAFHLKELSLEANGAFGILPDGSHGITSDYWPLYEDLEEAIDVLLRIHHIYGVNITEFASGKILGTVTSAKLQAVHCYEIGMYARSKGKFSLAVEWLKTAMKLTEVDQSMDSVLIFTAMTDTFDMHDEAFSKTVTRNTFLFMQPFESFKGDVLEAPTARSVLYKTYAGKRSISFTEPNFWGLCSGADFRIPQRIRHLFCWLERKIHPFFTLCPLKMEFLSRNPDIVQIYDIFSDKEMIVFTEENEQLVPSKVVDLEDKRGTGLIFSDSRTSCQRLDFGQRFSKKLELVSGFALQDENSAELTQVASYVVGGHYSPHIDSLQKEYVYRENGDRIATIMVYASNVDEGGYTAFTSAMAVAKPVKGSAVLWFNIFPDGTPDKDSGHGACPVVMGTKWGKYQVCLVFHLSLELLRL